MKLSSSFVALSAIFGSIFASAAPIRSRQANLAPSFNSGAAYFISNEPTGNFVVSADIGTDGQLSLARAFATNGRGQHGNDGKNGSDPLFSQGSVKANVAAGLVAAVNPGSNSVSLFKIDPNTPSMLTAFGSPMSTGGEFPMSLAFNQDGSMLCVLNGGAINGVKCFTMDQTLGLVPAANTWRPLGLNQTTPPTGPAGSASHIIFTEDQKNVIVAVKGNADLGMGGFLAAWDVMPDASLSSNFTRMALPAGGNIPFSLGVIPGKNSLLVTDAAVGIDVVDTAAGLAAASTSNRSTTLPVPGQTAICWNAFSRSTGNFYVTDIATSLVTEVNVDDNLKPTMVKQYPTQPNAATLDLDVASVGGKDYLYVLMPNVTSVEVMSLNAPGNATTIQTLALTAPASMQNLSISAQFLQGMTVYVKPQ
ncbi:hypothetical protein OF83DRAFT_1167471 [Amylostereum chailletii]|nr:hypothetical protein OF83DRAFT_1167471 [Amylostereum chailletii]